MVAAFLALCSPKGLRIGPDAHHLERSEAQAKELEAELQELLEPLIGAVPLREMSGVTVQAREGGILAAFGDEGDICTAQLDDRIVVFQGQLKNLVQLAQKCLAHSKPGSPASTNGHSRSNSQNGTPEKPVATISGADSTAPVAVVGSPRGNGTHPLPDASTLNPASVILLLYGQYGSPMLAQLTGRFSFCMYDAKQVRVLAARDGSGAIPLLQARSQRNSMVVSSNPALLKTCHDVLPFEPGQFKYGWQSAPRMFTAADAAPPHAAAAVRRSMEARRSIDHAAAHGANGSNRRSVDHAGRRSSTDHSHIPPLGGRKSVDAHGQGMPQGPSTPGRSSARVSMEAGASGGGGAHNGRAGSGRRVSSDAHHGTVHSPSRTTTGSQAHPGVGSGGKSHGGGSPPHHHTPVSKLQPRGSAPSPGSDALHAHLAHLNVNAKEFVPHAPPAPSS